MFFLQSNGDAADVVVSATLCVLADESHFLGPESPHQTAGICPEERLWSWDRCALAASKWLACSFQNCFFFFNLCVFQVKGEALNKETLNFSRENSRYSPENEHIFWLEDYFPFEMVPFWGRHSFAAAELGSIWHTRFIAVECTPLLLYPHQK